MSASIEVFTPLIYVQKSGRNSDWGRNFLEKSRHFIPEERKVQLILDALDFPESLLQTTKSTVPSYGLQMFGGVQVFEDPAKRMIFKEAVEQISSAIS